MDVERSPLCLYDYIQIGGTRICGPFKGYMIAPYDQGLIGKKKKKSNKAAADDDGYDDDSDDYCLIFNLLFQKPLNDQLKLVHLH